MDGNTPLTNYSDLVISRSISNLGIGGICVTSCTFKTRDAMETYGQCATVVLDPVGVGNVPTFYINKRTYSDGVWTVEALDRCAFLDRLAVTDEWSKIAPATPTDTYTYAAGTLLTGLREQCGFGNNSALPSALGNIPCDLIDGQNYQSILSAIALAYCGSFCCLSGNVLSFVNYNYQGSQTTLEAYSRLHDNGPFCYGAVKVTNGKASKTYTNLTAGVPCLEINNNFAKADEGDTNNEPYKSYHALGYLHTGFRGWSIDKAVCTSSDVPYIGGYVQINSTDYRITRVEARFVGSKMMLSMGQDIPQMGEIERRGLLQQKLDEAVSTQKKYKWLWTTYNGGIMVPTEDAEKGASS